MLKSSDLVLKREQKEALRAVCVEKRDCLCILPTGFGKSLIFQLVTFTLDYLTKVNTSCVLVVSPLNAIISDQIEKLESRGIEQSRFSTQTARNASFCSLFKTKSLDLSTLKRT